VFVRRRHPVIRASGAAAQYYGPQERSAFLTFAVLLFAYLFSQFFRSFLTIIAGDLTRDLGFGPAELGWVGSAWFIAFALCQLLVGYLLDTIGPRRTMAGMMLAGVAGAMVFALSNGFAVSVVGMALIGVGCSPMLMSGLYIFGRLEKPERFATLSSGLVGLGNIGNLVAATPLTLAAAAVGWRWSVAGIGAVMLVATMFCFLLLKDPARAERADGGEASVIGDLLSVLKIRALWFALPLHLVGYGVIATERGLWVGPYLEAVHGMTAIPRGNVVFAMSLGMALGALACAPAARHFAGPKPPAVIATAIVVGLFMTLGLASAIDTATAAAILTLIGFFGLTYSLLLSHGRQFIPDHLLGRGVTCLNFLAIGGAGLLQAATGRYMDTALKAGTVPASAYATMHLALGIALLAALLLFLRAPARRQPA
jgi:MFS family permease